MLVAYFDESGVHGNSEVVAVAGLVGDSMEWARMEQPWKKRLGNLAPFHATDCEVKKRRFEGLSEAECTSLSNDLARVIADRSLICLAYGMPRGIWDYGASDAIKSQFRTPYHFCLSAVLMQLDAISKKHWDSEPVAFVFAKQPEYQDYARSIHEVFAETKKYGGVGSITFEEPDCVIPLQAADLYSYENYRHILANIENPEAAGPPARTQLKIITERLAQRSEYAPLDMLHHMADEFDKLPTFQK